MVRLLFSFELDDVGARRQRRPKPAAGMVLAAREIR